MTFEGKRLKIRILIRTDFKQKRYLRKSVF